MDIKVDIDSAAVEAQLVQAIMGSAIGEHITLAINDVLNSKGYSYSKLIENAVNSAVLDKVRLVVSALLADRESELVARVNAQLTDDLLTRMTSQLFSRY